MEAVEQFAIEPLSEKDRPDLVAPLAEWILEAGEPYYSMLFGGRESALAAVRRWMARSSSEIALSRVRIASVGGSVAGGFIGLNGSELARARKADLIALTSADPGRAKGLLERLAALKGLFVEIEPDEYYLSKIFIALRFRGKNLSRPLLRAYLVAGQRAGHRRFALDVRADNAPAIRAYSRAGFSISARTSSVDGTANYLSMKYEVSP